MVNSAVFFDLDGTLIHTLDDLGHAMNGALAEQGLPLHSTDDFAKMIGGGMRKLVERASGGQGDQEKLLRGLMGRYSRHYVQRSRAYDGIHDLLRALRVRKVTLAVISNKHHGMTSEVVRRMFPDAGFGYVRGHQPPAPKKPDPFALLQACHALEVSPRDVFYVGDTEVDMKAALAAGMTPVAVSWGYRSPEILEEAGACHVLEHPSELLNLLHPLHLN
jgi:phosphoglycolate phosphatase